MRLLPPLAALLGAVALAAGCGSDTGGDGAAAGPATTAAHGHAATAPEGGIVEPRRQAPALRLRDVDGELVDIRDLRGDPVLVTFVYATCPDVCPLIMESLRRARREAGALGRRTRVLAVSVDPEGDTPAVVRAFLRARGVDGFVDYLVADRPALEAVWSRWNVATDVPADDPALIEHTALIYGVSASGELVTAYPVGFDAAAVARDLRLLART
ncbi:SCO family protein [Miltoncostaea marina]|uniref:SCO family protein n=1 Tax=Miltoncostaea marina TaxID=2843215 RepID=UPI001C3E1C9F|nr:SCO family protein [Miltoncostaea marina]